MADEADDEIQELDKSMFLREISETVNHILNGVLQEGRQKTVEILSVDLERDVLSETRETVLRYATERYWEQLTIERLWDKGQTRSHSQKKKWRESRRGSCY